MLVVRNVMKHARRKYDIEGIRFGRHAISLDEEIIVGFWEPGLAERQAAFADIGRRQQRIGKMLSKVANGIANPGPEVAYPGNIDITVVDDLPKRPDLVLGEILWRLTRDGDILPVLIVILIGETIEFDLVHGAT